jgi:hypothetical protein
MTTTSPEPDTSTPPGAGDADPRTERTLWCFGTYGADR